MSTSFGVGILYSFREIEQSILPIFFSQSVKLLVWRSHALLELLGNFSKLLLPCQFLNDEMERTWESTYTPLIQAHMLLYRWWGENTNLQLFFVLVVPSVYMQEKTSDDMPMPTYFRFLALLAFKIFSAEQVAYENSLFFISVSSSAQRIT